MAEQLFNTLVHKNSSLWVDMSVVNCPQYMHGLESGLSTDVVDASVLRTSE